MMRWKDCGGGGWLGSDILGYETIYSLFGRYADFPTGTVGAIHSRHGKGCVAQRFGECSK